jgi:hypothetical protein
MLEWRRFIVSRFALMAGKMPALPATGMAH